MAAFEAHCGARTGLEVLDPCSTPGRTRACTNSCGAGHEVCVGGYWQACVVPTTVRSCSNACGEGNQRCIDDTWLTCSVPVAKRPCSTVCGPGSETCTLGSWGACDAPPPGPPTLAATVRRFLVAQPDFLDACCSGGLDPGIVGFNLGANGRPVYLGTPGPVDTTHGAFDFGEWYHDVPGVNESSPFELTFVASACGGGQTVFSRPDTFDALPGMPLGVDGAIPNVTLEAHGQILYTGGETYSFMSDDDLWVFINRRLAVDLGGLHAALPASVDLDEAADTLGIEKGQRFPLDLFYANREPPDATLVIDLPDTDIWSCP